jgi:CBS domain containing-hemolysin-like protein
VLSKNTFIIENIIKEKQNIIKRLTSKKVDVEQVNIPLEKMVEIANNTLSNYLTTLNEEDLVTIKKYSTLNEGELSKRYEVLSEMVIEKLERLTKTSEKEVVSQINETISKIKNDKIDSVSLIKLKTLNESL